MNHIQHSKSQEGITLRAFGTICRLIETMESVYPPWWNELEYVLPTVTYKPINQTYYPTKHVMLLHTGNGRFSSQNMTSVHSLRKRGVALCITWINFTLVIEMYVVSWMQSYHNNCFIFIRILGCQEIPVYGARVVDMLISIKYANIAGTSTLGCAVVCT